MLWDKLKICIYEKWRNKWFETHPYDIAEYSWNYLFTGGKEIRPHLFCELWNYLAPESEIMAELAFAIECLHVASIVLDDTPWMDNAAERRGRKTLHTVFSPKKAVLIAYDIINIAIEIWTNNIPLNIEPVTWINLLKYKLQRLIVGQLYDLEKTGNLIELASLKTGVLFELVTETVALCNGLDTEFWKIWGNNLGILFQWMDDYLDMEEDKTQNNRNAFNESYTETLRVYEILWVMIEKGIGKQWFEMDIGKFMKQYFKSKFNFSGETYNFESLLSIKISSPNNISMTEFKSINMIPHNINKYVDNYIKDLNTEDNLSSKGITYPKNMIELNFISGKTMLAHLWNYLEKIPLKGINHDLWIRDESEWEEYTAKEYLY